ncbi:MAG: hypothetical protein AB4041_11905 [Microcystaceae cyanobacterium]
MKIPLLLTLTLILSLTTALTPVGGLKSEVGSRKESSALTSQKQTETIEQLFEQATTAYREGNIWVIMG